MAELTRTRKVVTILGLLGAWGLLAMLLLVRFVEVPAAPVTRGPRTPDGLHGLPAPVTAMPASSAALRSYLADRYRVRPDGRFLRAVTELQRLRGGPADEASARFERDHWTVLAGTRAVGTLPEHADFTDAMSLLTSFSEALERARPAEAMTGGEVPAEAAGWTALSPERPAWAALARVDQEWAAGHRSKENLAAAARALVALTVQTDDALEEADVLPARAMAALVLARRAGAPDAAGEALLADAMDYSSAARATARTLAEDDPVRAYVLGDHTRLGALAAADGAPGAPGYLWYRALIKHQDHAGAAAWAAGHFARIPETVALGSFAVHALPNDDVTQVGAASEALPARMLYALEREAGVATPEALQDASGILPRIEALGARRTTRGPFLDAALLRARDRAVIEAALMARVNFYLHTLSVPRRAAEYLALIAPTCPDAFSPFLNWVTHLTHVETGTVEVDALLRDVTEDSSLRGAELTASAARAFEALEPDDARHELVWQKLTTRLDARPSHRATVTVYARTTALDLVTAEAHCESLRRTSEDAFPAHAVTCAIVRGDLEAVRAFVRREDIPANQRAYALDVLDDQTWADPAFVDAEWRALLDAAPDSWDVRRGYCEWLKEKGRDADLLATANGWLRAHARDPGLDPIVAAAWMSGAQQRRGDLNAAWRSIQPTLASGQGTAMAQGARVLLAMGRGDDAEQLARTTLQRYPSGSTVALVAEVLWTRELLTQAADVIARSGVSLSGRDWRHELGAAFVRVYGAQPQDRALQALDALRSQGGVRAEMLQQLVRAVEAAGRHDLAYALIERLHASATGNMALLLERYELLRKVRGEAVAVPWMRAQVEPPQRGPLSMYVYEAYADELMWSVVEPPPGAPSGADYVWLLRAATSLRRGPADARRAEIERYFNDANGTDYRAMGRYLFGKIGPREVLAVARTADRRCEVSYLIALKAHCEGHTVEAADWYRLTLLTGNAREGEYGWARHTLSEWADRMESLERIAQNPWPALAARNGAPPRTLAPATPAPATATGETPAPEETSSQHGRRHRRSRHRH